MGGPYITILRVACFVWFTRHGQRLEISRRVKQTKQADITDLMRIF